MAKPPGHESDFDDEFEGIVFNIEDDYGEDSEHRSVTSTEIDATVALTVAVPHQEKSAGFVGSEMIEEMEDEYDSLMLDIDENDTKFTQHQKLPLQEESDKIEANISTSSKFPVRISPRKPNKRTNETSSFFSSQDYASQSESVSMKRSFPGPAGLLPEIHPEELKLVNSTHPPACLKAPSITIGPADSNGKVKKKTGKKRLDRNVLLNKANWNCLLKLLNLNIKDDDGLLSLMNIRWILNKLGKQSKPQKIPFLAVVVVEGLEDCDTSRNMRDKCHSIKLMDHTGRIVAAVDPDFVHAYGRKIIPGSAVALINCGVLTFRNQIVLTVAKKNLLVLANNPDLQTGEDKNISGEEFPTFINSFEDGVEASLMKIANLNTEKLLQDYKDITMSCKIASKTESECLQNNTMNITNHISLSDKPKSRLFTTFTKVSTVQNEPPNFDNENSNSMNFSAFDDDDDDEFMRALENVEFHAEDDSF